MNALLMLAHFALAQPEQPIICESHSRETFTFVQCLRPDVAQWSAEWLDDEDREPQHDIITVQVKKKCMWVQSRADSTRQPERVCPHAGSVKQCVLKRTVAKCLKK